MTVTVRFQSLSQPLTLVSNVKEIPKMQRLYGMILKMPLMKKMSI